MNYYVQHLQETKNYCLQGPDSEGATRITTERIFCKFLSTTTMTLNIHIPLHLQEKLSLEMGNFFAKYIAILFV